MVAPKEFEEPNLSYVRINQSSIDGSKESIKVHITKNMSAQDPAIVNSQILHKSMVEQPVQPRIGSTPLWKPVHLYTVEERDQFPWQFDTWEVLPRQKTVQETVKVQTTTVTIKREVSGKGAKKRTIDETEDTPNKKMKTSDESDYEDLKNRNKELEEENRKLQLKVEQMSRVMTDPKKLIKLMEYLQSKQATSKPSRPSIRASGTACG